MIEVKDFIYIASFVFMLVGGLVSLVGVYYKLQNRNELQEQNLINQQQQISKLEERVATHENKVETKLDEMIKDISAIREMLAKKG